MIDVGYITSTTRQQPRKKNILRKVHFYWILMTFDQYLLKTYLFCRYGNGIGDGRGGVKAYRTNDTSEIRM